MRTKQNLHPLLGWGKIVTGDEERVDVLNAFVAFSSRTSSLSTQTPELEDRNKKQSEALIIHEVIGPVRPVELDWYLLSETGTSFCHTNGDRSTITVTMYPRKESSEQ